MTTVKQSYHNLLEDSVRVCSDTVNNDPQEMKLHLPCCIGLVALETVMRHTVLALVGPINDHGEISVLFPAATDSVAIVVCTFPSYELDMFPTLRHDFSAFLAVPCLEFFSCLGAFVTFREWNPLANDDFQAIYVLPPYVDEVGVTSYRGIFGY